MQTKAMGPGAGWRWLAAAVNLGRNNPKALFGAAALMMGVALLPSLLQVAAIEIAGPENVQLSMAVALIATLALMLVFPLLLAGFLRVVHAVESGQPTRATALFDAFRAGHGRGRVIGIGMLLLAVYLLLVALVLGLAGREVAAWYVEVWSMAQAATPGAAPTLPQMPDGIGRVMALMVLVAMVVGGMYSIGFGQVALNGRGVGAAFGDAVAGTLKNVLPLLVLALLGLVGMVVAAVVIALVVLFLVMLGGLVSPALGAILAIPVYAAFLVMLYVVMFGVMYFIWRDVCGGAVATTPVADHAGFEA